MAGASQRMGSAQLQASGSVVCHWPALAILGCLHTSRASRRFECACHVLVPLGLGAALLFQFLLWFVTVVALMPPLCHQLHEKTNQQKQEANEQVEQDTVKKFPYVVVAAMICPMLSFV